MIDESPTARLTVLRIQRNLGLTICDLTINLIKLNQTRSFYLEFSFLSELAEQDDLVSSRN